MFAELLWAPGLVTLQPKQRGAPQPCLRFIQGPNEQRQALSPPARVTRNLQARKLVWERVRRAIKVSPGRIMANLTRSDKNS